MFFCQEKKHNKEERGEISSYSKIETQLKKFIEIDPMYIELKTLETHNAGYHKKCYDKIGQKEYNGLLARVGKKPCSKANSSSSTVISHKRKKLSLEQSYNFFVERDSKKTCVLLESFTLVVLRIINMSRN